MIQNNFSFKEITKNNLCLLIIVSTLLIAGCSSDTPNDEDPRAYITNQKGNIQVLSLSDFTIIDEIDVGKGARGLGITSDGNILVVAVRDSNDLALVNTKNYKTIKRIPIGENPEFVRVKGDKAFVSFEPAAIGRTLSWLQRLWPGCRAHLVA